MTPTIFSEATDKGVVVYADLVDGNCGFPVLVATKLGQLAKLGEDAFRCNVPLTIKGEPYTLTDHRLCMKLAGECARVAFSLAG